MAALILGERSNRKVKVKEETRPFELTALELSKFQIEEWSIGQVRALRNELSGHPQQPKNTLSSHSIYHTQSDDLLPGNAR